ncbi:penicillin-binding protein 2 [Sphingomicrobium astaxanthinifaciens]|uniref:penicillin-binding protein 2 n=1 Tax=Sphingomicrobium astaxanthinifaciens TaxID=1227949 RepID=UPI001FCA8B50|nr:penicillin-binding protein 2 [Sphingomicrobium astaxanthinifaciens]MCJ7420292.1 penicillin-binding protein 2 [Sphingomicrobium astaxanthinifaciens]
MAKPPKKPARFTEAQRDEAFSRRSLLVGGIQTVLGGALIARLGYLSISQNQYYQTMAEDNRVQMIIVPPRRGWLVDRNGKPIAINRSDFRVDMIADQVPEGQVEVTLKKAAALLDLDPDQVERISTELATKSGYQPVQLAENVAYENYAAVTVRLPDLEGVLPQRGFSRYYPAGSAVGHLVGYVGIANREEYVAEDKNPLLVTPGFKIGKEGLEEVLEPQLRGQPGGQRVELTARGKLVRELEPKPDRSGNTVRLAIDVDLQEYAARRLGLESGAVVVIDVPTGDILCLASMPAYDPNSFSDGIGRTEWKLLSENERRPLVNKTVNSLYPPGSCLKPMNTLAFQAAGIDPDERVHCNGGYQLGRRFFRCLKRHGSMNMRDAIMKSCNTYFYAMAHRTGYDVVAEMARKLTLGMKYDLPLVSQSYGTIPDSEWKLRKYDQRWTAADSLNASIGQGYVILNPLQLAVHTARIASGRAILPRLIGVHADSAPPLDIPEEHLAVTRQGMWQVVNAAGTAGTARVPVEGVEVAGKTGTSQVRGLQYGDGKNVPWKYKDHGHFVCYAPFDQPRYAMAVTVEHGGTSGAATPIARDVMTFLFDREKAMEQLVAYEEQWGGSLAEREAAFQRRVLELAQANAAARAASDETA